MTATFTGNSNSGPRPSRILRAFFWTLGLGLLLLGGFGVMIDYGSTPSWEATYSIRRGEQRASTGTSITTRGGRTAQAVYSLLLMCGVRFIAAGRGVDRQQYSLRALLLTVLLTGAAGSLPYMLIRPLAMQATIQLEYTPFIAPPERAAVIARLRRDVILSELPSPDRERFDRVRFTVKAEEIGDGGLKIVLGFPESTPPAQRDSITSFCGQYAQLLLYERLPWISQEARPQPVVQSDWIQTSSYEWEMDYRRRREQAKQSANPLPQRPPP